jgi:predicted TIM-barrel fold metal-dependent hydrolase
MTMATKFQVPFPPDPNPKTPRFAVPAGTCDTHFHVFGPPEVFPYVASRLYTPPAAPIEHYLSMAKAIGMERGVLVVPAVHGFENDVMHDALAKAEGRLRGMIRASDKLTTADNRALHERGVRGIRFNAVHQLGGEFDGDATQRIIARLADLPWAVDFHIEAQLIEANAELLRRIDKPVIIDHFGLVDSRKGLEQSAFRVLLDLAALPHIWVKISGADRRLYAGERYEDIVALARALIARAPDRIIWGTDWPHAYVYQAGRQINDGDLIGFMLDYAPDEAARRKILVDNPARLFGFP